MVFGGIEMAYEGFDKDANTVIGLIEKHLPSAQVIWRHGQGKMPTAAELQEIAQREQERADTEFERWKNTIISSIAAKMREADLKATLAVAFANAGIASEAERSAIQAHRLMKEALREVWFRRALIFTPMEEAELWEQMTEARW
jgi:hypothetical protein